MNNIKLESDLVTPDGCIQSILSSDLNSLRVLMRIEGIAPDFCGFADQYHDILKHQHLQFNIKSTLAQIGLDGLLHEYVIDRENYAVDFVVHITAYGEYAQKLLSLLDVGCYIGRLFCSLPDRLVRTDYYVKRILNNNDWYGNPLLAIGNPDLHESLEFQTINNRVVAKLPLLPVVVRYKESIVGFFSTLIQALKKQVSVRHLLPLHQEVIDEVRKASDQDILLVMTQPLCIQSMFAKVAKDCLPKGYAHTSANIIEPTTLYSGNIYELFGEHEEEITDIPLEFYMLQPHKEHVSLSDRNRLGAFLNQENYLFNHFEDIVCEPDNVNASTIIHKGSQFEDSVKWNKTIRGKDKGTENYSEIKLLDMIEKDQIKSEGVLFTRYFPSYLIKPLLLNPKVLFYIKSIYFAQSKPFDSFFSIQDRSMMVDLWMCDVPVYWVHFQNKRILKYVQKPSHSSGLFLPENMHSQYLNSALVGVYGSTVIEYYNHTELNDLLIGVHNIIKNQTKTDHSAISIVTGGGPGMMQSGNNIAKQLEVPSCAHLVEFKNKESKKINAYIDGFMTYRLDELIKRQSNFNLDICLFFPGGVGTDAELAIEMVNRKAGAGPPSPMLLFGPVGYWENKVNALYTENLNIGTLKGIEWISNSIFIVRSTKEALFILEKYYTDELLIGKDHPYPKDGYKTYDSLISQPQ